MTKHDLIYVCEKLELVVHRAAHKFEKGTREFDTLKILAYELHRMEQDVRKLPDDPATDNNQKLSPTTPIPSGPEENQ